MKKQNNVWTNGLKIDSTLDLNLDCSIARVKNNKASLYAIDGGVGEGKTTLAVLCGQRVAIKLHEPFDIIEQVRMGGSDFLKGMTWCIENNRHVIVYDEAGDFNTRASLTYFNQNMNRVFETYRALGIVVILCLPSFADIDTSLMKKKIMRGLIHCYGRNNNYGNYSSYSLWRCWYLKQKLTKLIVPDDMYKCVTPNFRGRFKNLDLEESELLKEYSIKGKKDIIKKGMLKDKGMINVQEITSKTGYSKETIRRYIKKKNIKGEKYGATLYYHKDILDHILMQKEREGRVAL